MKVAYSSLLLIVLLALTGCSTSSTVTQNTLPAQHISCEEQALALLPQYLTLYGPVDGRDVGLPNNIWGLKSYTLQNGDSYTYNGDLLLSFTPGKLAGQNANYYYVDQDVAAYFALAGTPPLRALVYEKQVISPGGDIQGTRTFTAYPVLRATQNSSPSGLHGFKENREFDVVSYNISQCNWVS